MKIAFYLAVLTPSNSKIKKAAVPKKDVLLNNHSKLTRVICLNLKQMFQKRYCDVINREKKYTIFVKISKSYKLKTLIGLGLNRTRVFETIFDNIL